MGKQGILVDTTDDEFSHLRDEIYKTVTALYQTRDEAIKAKENYADNLANIAHQLKTPITALLLSVQMMRENPSSDNLAQIERSAGRLQAMEEALLLLSRLDSGTLCLKQEKVDVFTLLTLAFDNLQELFRGGGSAGGGFGGRRGEHYGGFGLDDGSGHESGKKLYGAYAPGRLCALFL